MGVTMRADDTAHAARAWVEGLRRDGVDVVEALRAAGVLTQAELAEWFFAPIRRVNS